MKGLRRGQDGPRVKSVLLGLLLFCVLMVLVMMYRLYISSGEDEAAKLQILGAPPARVTDQKGMKRKNIGMVTAWKGGLHWDITARMSSDTKARYAAFQGYTFYIDNRKDNTLNKNQMRFHALREHLHNHSWLYWSESEILIVNPLVKLDSFIDDNYDLIITKDWGGRQIATGSFLLRNSEGALRILSVWEELMDLDEHNSDLRALQKIMDERPGLAKKIKIIDQRLINSYPSLELKDKSVQMNRDTGHAYYQDEDFVVHVVNCVGNWDAADPLCCHGIAAHYFHIFHKRLKGLLSVSSK